jgi:serine/threonine-protein kinase
MLSSDGLEDARFLPGTTVADRYRIIGLLGKGGMGEVYRADDLKLGQAVALKFLPESLGEDQERVRRFFNEVRIARQVTHPNVCRVYDIGEVEGHHYISMEYVDGEDLSTRLKPIGRLPKDKAVQIARQLCAGLASAHDRGILHRDLKPANVMIDGRGHVRVTDFGLAGLVEEIQGLEVRSGTPAYMAPEQLAGEEVSVRSDVYSLGLVLYELFTGSPAFEASSAEELRRLQTQSTPTSPSSFVEGFDPAVERLLQRCLDQEPAQRPASALGVAAALPGGDPLAAALAAGETPSPEMVAAAGAQGGMRPGVAAACLVSVVAFVLLQFYLVNGFPELSGIFGWVSLPHPPAVLAREASELLEKLGYDEPPADTAFGFARYTTYLSWIQENDASRDRWQRLTDGGPPGFFFWYRQSPRALLPLIGSSITVADSDPYLVYSGEASVHLGVDGRLDMLRVIPPQVDEASGPSPEMDWSILFEAAGLDREQFEPTDPTWIPVSFADARAAWKGTWPEFPDIPVRIEAAAYQGKIIWFDILEPWDRPWKMTRQEPQPGQRFVTVLFSLIFVSLMVGAVLLARRNLRLGHGDRKGAFKVALFVLVVQGLEWLLRASHVPDLNQELQLFFRSFPSRVFLAAMVWLVYIALEPFLRSRWPDAMVSWSRLLAGRLRDPLIGRDILVGGCAFAGFVLLSEAQVLVNRLLNVPPPTPPSVAAVLLGGRHLLGDLVNRFLIPILFAGGILFLLLLLRVVLRKHWLAVGALLLLLTAPGTVQADPRSRLTTFVFTLLLWSMVYFVVSRFGLLSLCATFFFLVCFAMIPDMSLSTWYASATIVPLLTVAVILGYAFVTALAGRSLFAESMVPRE